MGADVSHTIAIQPMNANAFAPFGDLIDFNGLPSFSINNGMCDRYHGLAHAIVTDEGGQPAISLGRGKPYELPMELTMMERHPLGSQAFIPLVPNPFLVIVATDISGEPGTPLAFITEPGQGVNYRPNTWHAVLTPLHKVTDFVIVDRIGDGANLEEHFFKTPYLIVNEA